MCSEEAPLLVCLQKTEQSDLMQALYGRKRRCSDAGDCSPVRQATVLRLPTKACRIAVKYMTPVLLLSDGYLANGSEPWLIPDPDSLNAIDVTFADKPNHKVDGEDVFWPYLRDEKDVGPPLGEARNGGGSKHRVGGLEKEDGSGQRFL